MPSTYDDAGVGVNARKTSPSSLFGTRQLKFLYISFDYNLLTDDGNGSYKDSDSLYNYVVKAIQEVAELYYLGAPTYFGNSEFVFAIADTTAQWYYSDEGVHDVNEIGIDETDDVYPNRYFPDGSSAVNDLVDRLYNSLGSGWWTLKELEDTGWGLLPGPELYY